MPPLRMVMVDGPSVSSRDHWHALKEWCTPGSTISVPTLFFFPFFSHPWPGCVSSVLAGARLARCQRGQLALHGAVYMFIERFASTRERGNCHCIVLANVWKLFKFWDWPPGHTGFYISGLLETVNLGALKRVEFYSSFCGDT